MTFIFLQFRCHGHIPCMGLCTLCTVLNICFNGGRVKEVAEEPKERKLKAQDQHLQVMYVEF